MGSRRGKTGYLIFANERRLEVLNQLKEQNKGSQKVALANVSKELGRLWNELTEEQRQQYKTQAANSNTTESDVQKLESKNTTVLPLATIKKIMTSLSNEEVKRISSVGLKTMAMATELFLQLLAEKCMEYTKSENRSTIKVMDLESTLRTDGFLDADPILDKISKTAKGMKRSSKGDSGETSKRQKTNKTEKVKEKEEDPSPQIKKSDEEEASSD